MKPQGAGYEVEREDIVTSTDNWFRPSDICVAPDGSVFVADWYDPGVGGHGMGDTTRGRVYRLAPKGHKYEVPKVDLESKTGLYAALRSPALSVRYMAMAKLHDMPPKSLVTLLADALSQGTDPILRIRAAWQAMPRRSELAASAENKEQAGILSEAMADMMKGADKRFAVAMTRAAPRRAEDFQDVLLKVIRTLPLTTPERRELLLSLQQIDATTAKPFILELAKHYDGQDRFYLAAIGIAVGTDPKRREIILADFDKYFPEWNDRVADLVWELRPPSVMPRLEKLLTDAKLPASQRARIVDILAAAPDADSGARLLKVLEGDPPLEVRERILANVRLFLPGKWRSLNRGETLGPVIDKLLAKSETAPTGLTLIATAGRTEAVSRIRALLEGPNVPAAVQSEAVKTLGELRSPEAVTVLQSLLQRSASSPLGVAVVEALGRHLAAPRFGPPSGPGGFGPPPGGPGRGRGGFGSPDDTSRRAALETLQAVVRNKDGRSDLSLRQAALSALAGSQSGTQWLLHEHEIRALPQELVAETGRLLRNSPFQGLRNRALIAFPAAGKLDPAKLPPISVLATRTGDAGRGKQLLADSLKGDAQCLKCHAVQGVGGNVGPDLSMIGKKASRENLYESILTPSKAIADQFVNWQIATLRGTVLSGLIVEETADAVTLRDANGKDTRIPKKEIESRTKNPVSLMPEDIVRVLTEEELVDLVEYLTTLKTPALSLPSWRVAGPFPNGPNDEGLDRDFGPEKAIDLQATYAGKGGPVRWRTVTADAQGYVDLRALHESQSDQSVSYLLGTIESPADQDVKFLLGTDDGAKLWVNDQLVYTTRKHRAAVPGEDTVAVKLRKGRNRLLLKVANGDGPHGFYLTIISDQELQTAGDTVR